jgi:hypothetical protein
MLQFHLGGARRLEHAIALLREARKRGARDPELIEILNRHDQRASTGQRDADALLDVIDRYLRDPTVRASIRSRLVQQRARFGKLREWDERPDLAATRVAQPTVAELSDRAALLMERVRLLGDAGGRADLDAALLAANELAEASERLALQARAVEQQEAAVLALISDALLAEHGG